VSRVRLSRPDLFFATRGGVCFSFDAVDMGRKGTGWVKNLPRQLIDDQI
jgi:hypothetical protein